KSECWCQVGAGNSESSQVVLELIKGRVEVVSHLYFSFEDVPRQFPAPLRNSGKPGHRLATVGDEDLFARSRPFDQPRETALGVMHIHYRSHENHLSPKFGLTATRQSGQIAIAETPTLPTIGRWVPTAG